MRLLSEVAVLSKTKEATQTLEQTIAEEPGKAEPQQKSAKWFYQIEQLNARFVERYAKFVEAAAEEKEVKSVLCRHCMGTWTLTGVHGLMRFN